MATFTTVQKQKFNWVAPVVVPGIIAEVDFLFSDGTDYVFSDSTDFLFSEETTNIRTETPWTVINKS